MHVPTHCILISEYLFQAALGVWAPERKNTESGSLILYPRRTITLAQSYKIIDQLTVLIGTSRVYIHWQ